MKLMQISSVMAALFMGSAHALGDIECRDKQDKDTCHNRVRVNSTSSIFGLVDDVPEEVFEAFVTASTDCLQCVDKSSVHLFHSRNKKCKKDDHCKGCGLPSEDKKNCKQCCGVCRCMGCEWNYGNDRKATRKKRCDKCCVDPNEENNDRRRLAADADTFIEFKIDVCMDDLTPLDSEDAFYSDYADMLDDFQTELQECYDDKDGFMSRWSSLAANHGIDLALLARDDGGTSRILFGMDDMDTENVAVTSSDSSGSHRSTSNMMFYSALGFVTVAAFAVFGTALVVQVLRKRRESKELQEAQWVSELSAVDTTNPVQSAPESL